MSIYLDAAQRYLPLRDRIKALIIAESPPYHGEGERPRYFYFNELTGKEYLFRNIMRVILPGELAIAERTKDKVPALRFFCDKLNFFLIDACDYPINNLSTRFRIKEIEKGLTALVERVEGLVSKTTPIILIKRSTLGVVQAELSDRGYFLCRPRPLAFPTYGNQNKFRLEFREALRVVGGIL